MKKIFTKIVAALLVVSTIGTFAACKKKNIENTTVETEEYTGEIPTVAITASEDATVYQSEEPPEPPETVATRPSTDIENKNNAKPPRSDN